MGDTGPIAGHPDPSPPSPPSTRVRVFVYGFLALFLACGFLALELWPLTGFRLYHRLRTEERESTAVVALLADGEERSLQFHDLPLGWHLTNRILTEFPDLSAAEQDEVCDAWVQPLRESGEEVVGVRVDRVLTHLGEPDRPPEVVGVAYRCGT